MAYILADHRATDWCVVIGSQASPSEHYTAEELQSFLKQMSGAVSPIVRDSAPIYVQVETLRLEIPKRVKASSV